MTPFFSTTYRPILKGFRSTIVLPADYLLFWIRTLIVSIGCMTLDAIEPERDPTRNGLTYPQIEDYVIIIK